MHSTIEPALHLPGTSNTDCPQSGTHQPHQNHNQRPTKPSKTPSKNQNNTRLTKAGNHPANTLVQLQSPNLRTAGSQDPAWEHPPDSKQQGQTHITLGTTLPSQLVQQQSPDLRVAGGKETEWGMMGEVA